jgi:hypothetical protein
MLDAPQQDWSLYRELTRNESVGWIRDLTPQRRFEIYDDFYKQISKVRRDPSEWVRLENWRWEKKLAQRFHMIEAFKNLDHLRRERAAANDAC